MKQVRILILLFTLMPSKVFAKDIIVSATGAHNGAGTLGSPMSLWRAIGMVDMDGNRLRSNPAGIVEPGDHVKLLGGTYVYTLPYEPRDAMWTVFNRGTAANVIWIE